MNKPTDKIPLPLTEAEEAEMKKLNDKLFGDSMFAVIEERTPEVDRYDELMSKKLTYMQFCFDRQVAKERRLMRLN